MGVHDLVDDYHLNLLDLGGSNVLTIVLGGIVYLWEVSDGSILDLLRLNEEFTPEKRDLYTWHYCSC